MDAQGVQMSLPPCLAMVPGPQSLQSSAESLPVSPLVLVPAAHSLPHSAWPVAPSHLPASHGSHAARAVSAVARPGYTFGTSDEKGQRREKKKRKEKKRKHARTKN